jgi:hypothetical protein
MEMRGRARRAQRRAGGLPRGIYRAWRASSTADATELQIAPCIDRPVRRFAVAR